MKKEISKVGKNYLSQMSIEILNFIFPFITTPYLSRVLGVTGIGSSAYFTSLSTIFSLFAMLGISNYGNRKIAQSQGDKDTISSTFWSVYFLQLINSLYEIIHNNILFVCNVSAIFPRVNAINYLFVLFLFVPEFPAGECL